MTEKIWSRRLEINDSENLQWIGYDLQTKEMVIQFQSGGLYHYSPVPLWLFGKIASAESAGKAFQALLRNNRAIKATRLEL
jgi:hypothetical protein